MAVRIVLRKDAGKLGFPPDPWIRRRAVSRELGPPDPAALACVVDHRDQVLGWGTYSPDSELCVRLLVLGEAPPPPDWLGRRIEAAWRARRSLGLGVERGDGHTTTGYREINSEGDGLPGLVVDRYGDARVVVMSTAPMVARATEISGVLGGLDPRPTLMIAPEAAGRREGFEAALGHEHGAVPERLAYLERGLRFEVPAPPAQKTGGYHDQRDNRDRVASLAAAGGGRLLDLGCHVGGFAIHAARAGVDVVAVDRSALALEFVAKNAEKNAVGQRVTTVESDMFGPLDASPLAGPFGTIVFDPPKVASSRRDVPRAVAAMQRTTKILLERLAEGGRLVLCSCSQHLDDVALDRVAAGAAASLGRTLTRTARWGPGEDHPVAPGHPQGDYLRVHTYQPR